MRSTRRRRPTARAREIRAELHAVFDHDLAATRTALKPKRARLDETAAESSFLQEQLDAADADITSAAERLSILGAELAGMRKEEELLRLREVSLVDAMAVWSGRSAETEPPSTRSRSCRPPPQPLRVGACGGGDAPP